MISNKEKMVRGVPRQNMLVGFPTEIRATIEEARQVESELTRSQVSLTEFIVKATVDRVGTLLGESRANYLYRRYFNGIGYTNPATESAINSPSLGDAVPRDLNAPQLYNLMTEDNDNE